jgi:hypothetical protein
MKEELNFDYPRSHLVGDLYGAIHDNFSPFRAYFLTTHTQCHPTVFNDNSYQVYTVTTVTPEAPWVIKHAHSLLTPARPILQTVYHPF